MALAMLKEGDQAPDFALSSSEGEEVKVDGHAQAVLATLATL